MDEASQAVEGNFQEASLRRRSSQRAEDDGGSADVAAVWPAFAS